MKSLKRRFQKISDKNPMWSTYICFAETIKKQNFTRKSILYWFNKLVEKDDYDKKNKKELIDQLCELTKPADEGIKQG